MANKYLEKVAMFLDESEIGKRRSSSAKRINPDVNSAKMNPDHLKELRARKMAAETVLSPGERLARRAGKIGAVAAGVGAVGYGAKKMYDKVSKK